MSTALATTTDRRTDVSAFEPSSIDEALSVAKLLVASRLLPRSITTPEAAFAVIVTGRELGLSAMQALRSVHIVEGKPTLSADLMVALVKRSDACIFFRLVESTGERAVYETHRRGEPSPTRLAFTIEQARAAGVATKDVWKRYADAMLRARCAAALARAVFPDLVLGVYDPDELASPINVTPEPAPAPAPVPVEPAPAPAPATARRKATKPAEAPAPVVEEIVEAEVVEAPAEAPRSELIEAIIAADDLAAAKAVLSSARIADLSAEQLGAAFGTVLARCSTAADCNDTATIVVAWKKAGAIAEPVVEQLRRAYLDRKAAVAVATKGA